MKAAIPREVVYSRGGFEENDRRAGRRRRAAADKSRHARDLEIIEAPDQSALETLIEEFRQTMHG